MFDGRVPQRRPHGTALLATKTVDGNAIDALDTDDRAIDAPATALLAAKTGCIAIAVAVTVTVSLSLLMSPT